MGALAALVLAGGLLAVLLSRAGSGSHPAVTPFGAPKVTELAQLGGDHAQRMLWGTYRPGYYFGKPPACLHRRWRGR